ncbi:MAG: hypothetical protein R2754_03740 [Microthrixaceae bacterium]
MSDWAAVERARGVVPVRAALAVATRPDLWPTAARAAVRFRPRPGGRPGPYLRFRTETQYGGSGRRAPDPADAVAYLEWLRLTRHRRRR